MKVGIKIYSDSKEKMEYALRADFADFIEVMALSGKDLYLPLLKESSKPMAVHAPHLSMGYNPADRSLFKNNIAIIDEVKRAADYLGADKIVIHSGHVLNPGCSRACAVENILASYDPRFCIENLFQLKKDEDTFCTTPDEFRSLLKDTGANMCLDLAHACAAANWKGVNYRNFLEDFISINPRHYHISGGSINALRDGHLSIFEGDYPIDYFKSILPENAAITLETPQNFDVQKRECEFMRI